MDAAPRSSMPAPGELVAGRYRIEQVLGQGGMGVVLAAHDEEKDTPVAIKLLQSITDSNTERFAREARLASMLATEHVVRVFDAGAIHEHPYLVMERLRGRDFAAKLRGCAEGTLRGLSLTEVADCVVQACEALAHAHGAGIVHRDIKASNLFEHVREDGSQVVKVLDFGISKLFGGPHEPERTLTRTKDGGFLGSPPYMSPEHVHDPRDVDARSDIWSLGVVAYRLLSGRYPFPGETTGQVLAAVLMRRHKFLREVGVDVSEEVDSIIARCLSRAREYRFGDAGQLARAFAPYASSEWRAYGAGVPAIVLRTPPRHRETDDDPHGKAPIVLGEARTQTVPPPSPGPDAALPWRSPPSTPEGTVPPAEGVATIDESPTVLDERTKTLDSSFVQEPRLAAPLASPGIASPLAAPRSSATRARFLLPLLGVAAVIAAAALARSALRARRSTDGVSTGEDRETASVVEASSASIPSARVAEPAAPPRSPTPAASGVAATSTSRPQTSMSARGRTPSRPPRPATSVTPAAPAASSSPPAPSKRPDLQPNPYGAP